MPGVGRMWLSCLIVAALSAPILAVPARASDVQDVEIFYKSNPQLTLLVGFGPGSGYDNWARLIARHMPKHIPGAPTMVVKNMAGAGSLVAANHLANVAPKDGSVIGVFTRNLPAQALIGRKGVRFDPRDLGWIGSPEIPSRVCAVLSATGVKDIADLRKIEVPVGGTGPRPARRPSCRSFSTSSWAPNSRWSKYIGARKRSIWRWSVARCPAYARVIPRSRNSAPNG